MLPARLHGSRHFCCTGTTTRGPIPSSCVYFFSGLEREGAEHECTMRWMVQAVKGNGGTMFRVASFGDFCLIQVCNVKSTQWAAGCYGNTCCRCWSRCVRDTWGFQETCACPPVQIIHQTWHKNKTPGAGLHSFIAQQSFVLLLGPVRQVVLFTCPDNIYTHTVNKWIT